MTEYADKEICERLRRLSGWIDTFAWYNGDAIEFEGEAGYEGAVYENTMQYDWSTDIPAYTLAFILDKLPKTYTRGIEALPLILMTQGNHCHAFYGEQYVDEIFQSISATPTNAAALLACALFEKGILKGAAQNGDDE